MSDTTAALKKKISGAQDLQSVVRSMKALAAASIGQYEKSVAALGDYYKTVELGLGVCFRSTGSHPLITKPPNRIDHGTIGVIVFGSDQGLVGQFNDIVAEYAVKTLTALPGKPAVWAVGERVHARLADAGLSMAGRYPVPSSVEGIAPLVSQIQVDSEAHRVKNNYDRVYVFHNKPRAAASYDPVSQRLLPLDAKWQQTLTKTAWPTAQLPQMMCAAATTLRALIREYLFISLFKASAESLASENASRLASMQRADKNIDDLLETLHANFHRIRQGGIDEELFDVISGFDALSTKDRR